MIKNSLAEYYQKTQKGFKKCWFQGLSEEKLNKKQQYG